MFLAKRPGWVFSRHQIIEESKIIQEFEINLVKEIEKVCYGLEESLKAAEHGAIASFLINNSFLTQHLSEEITFLLDLLVKTKVKLLIVNERSDNGQIAGPVLSAARY